MDDRSLDEFARSGEDAESTTESSEPAPVTSDSTSGERSQGTVEPATGTARWSGDGEACGACGDRVSRLWFENGQMVCSSCKEW
jgi:hypothetical protein